MNNYFGKLSASIKFGKLETLNDIHSYYYYPKTEITNYSLILLVDKNTSERIWAMYCYFKPLDFTSIIISKTNTLYSLKTINTNGFTKEPFKMSIRSNTITNEEDVPEKYRSLLFEHWVHNGKWDFNKGNINRNSQIKKITDDYDVYSTLDESNDSDEMLIINYYMKSFVNINNPIKDLVLANESISKNVNRISLPQTSVRDIASFIDPKYGLPPATKKGGRKLKRRIRKSRRRCM